MPARAVALARSALVPPLAYSNVDNISVAPGWRNSLVVLASAIMKIFILFSKFRVRDLFV